MKPTPRALTLAVFALAFAALTGCKKDDDDPLTREEADEALQEAQVSTEAAALTDEMVVLTTDFALGDAVEAAAANLRDFLTSQVPCADVGLVDRTVTLDFGATGDCEWKGRTWTGRVEVSIARVDTAVEVGHRWTALSDGYLTVDGEATVTWDRDARTRRVVHQMSWTDGEVGGSSTGDRTQSRLESMDGIRVDGARTWTGRAGRTWALDIDGVELRALDPLPQAGTYTLSHPNGKSLTMTFARVDERTIQVTVANGRRTFDFQVRSTR